MNDERARSAETSRMERPFGDFFEGTSATFATGAGSARSMEDGYLFQGLIEPLDRSERLAEFTDGGNRTNQILIGLLGAKFGT